MNPFLKRIMLGFFVRTNGVISAPLFSGSGHILCFHRVLPSSQRQRIYANSGLEITPEKLMHILNFFMDRNYEIISINRLYERILKGIKSKKKFLVLTFDDGYMDNYQYAYPLLKKNNIPFTVYIATDFPDQKAVLWWYCIEDFILNNTKVPVFENNVTLEFNTELPNEKQEVFLKIRNQFLNQSFEKNLELLTGLYGFSQEKIADFCWANALSWDHISEMANDPLVSIGAHCISHKPLYSMNEELAWDEISSSKKIIEQHIHNQVEHFAYPFGTAAEFGSREISMVYKAGYKTSVTLQQGNIFRKHKNHFYNLPRIPLGEHTTDEALKNIINGIRQFSFNGFCKINGIR